MRKALIFFTILFLAGLMSGVTVYEVQYTEDASGDSPLVGQIVTVTGIVSAVNWYTTAVTTHFCITDPEGGAWHGVFVYNFDFTVELGDEVEVTATVQEYYGWTELSSVTNVTILSSGNPIPPAIEVTTLEVSGTEAYEGVLVQVNNVTVTQDPNNYGEAFITDGSGECQTDDAMYNYGPALGANYSFIRGIVDYSYDEYGLNPRTAEDIGFAGEPGYIEGQVDLDGGTGNLVDVVVTAGSITTNCYASGEYELELPPGTYNVTASLDGYGPQTITGVLVEEDETTSGVDFVLTPAAEATIYDIQYTEDVSGDSPMVGQVVTVTGIVTGAGYVGNNYFFLSSPEGGAWNGIYVYQSAVEVAEGDEVTFNAMVSEYFGLTELGSVTGLVINSSGNALPDPVLLTSGEAGTEAYESVLVHLEDLTVTQEPDPGSGEWYVNDGSGALQVDDGFFYLNEVEPPIVINVGTVVESLTGILDYAYDEYGVQPRYPEDIVLGSAADENVISADLNLQAFPNPFIMGVSRSMVNISFDLENEAEVTLSVYNLKGQKVKELAEGLMTSGSHSVYWQGDDLRGKFLPSGVYFYRLQADNNSSSGKLLLFR
ncbi:MAG: carboxypeptidase regulatory-like domain-containing protein [Candidatus Cloacimonetes bacterium]|nr:carboxypeptidase regulatory-like domain-containing protein [Candidatus Cloacimonadota bacterium]